MAKLTVPSYQPQVAARGLPSVRAQTEPDALGLGQVARGLQQLGQGAGALAQVAQRAQDEADATMAVEAETRLRAAATKGTRDRDTGVLNLQGKAAADASGSLYETLEKTRSQLADTYLQNDRQRRVFNKRAADLMDGVRSQVETHVAQETRRAAESAAQGRVSIALDTIANDYQNPEVLRREVDAAQSAVLALSTASPEEKAARVQALHAEVTKTVLGQYLAKGDGQGARAFFKENADLLGNERGSMEKAITQVERTQKADTLARGIVSKANVGEGYPWVDGTKALLEVEALNLPAEERDEVRTRVAHQVQERQALQKQAGNEHLNAILSIREQTGNPHHPAIAQHLAWLLDPKNGSADLAVKYRNEVERDARERLSASRGNARELAEARRAQALVDQQLLEEFKGMTPEERLQVQVDQYGLGLISPTARARVRQVFNKTAEDQRKGGASGESEFYRTLDEEAVRGGISPKDRASLMRFRASMGDWRREYLERSGGKPPTRQEVDAELARYRVKQPGGWFGRDKTGFQLVGEGRDLPAPSATEAAAPRVGTSGVDLTKPAQPEVPPEERKLIEEALKHPVDDKEALRLYRLRLARQGTP